MGNTEANLNTCMPYRIRRQPQEGLERDNEAASCWNNSAERSIINGNKHDNFWNGWYWSLRSLLGNHIDLRPAEERAKFGRDLVKPRSSCNRNMESRIYAIQRKADGSPNRFRKSNRYRYGFERLCMVLYRKNLQLRYGCLQPMIKAIAKMAGVEYGKRQTAGYRHARNSRLHSYDCFSITDGQLPSNAVLDISVASCIVPYVTVIPSWDETGIYV